MLEKITQMKGKLLCFSVFLFFAPIKKHFLCLVFKNIFFICLFSIQQKNKKKQIYVFQAGTMNGMHLPFAREKNVTL